MNNKLTTKNLIFGLIVVAALATAGFLLWEKADDSKSVSVGEEEKKVDENYKKVRVSDGVVSFSFEVPGNWLVETRHSGEKKLSIEEMRQFLATNYDGDLREKEICNDVVIFDGSSNTEHVENVCSEPYGDYWDVTWDMLEKISGEEIRSAYNREYDKWIPYPNASVSAGEYIWYNDSNGSQVDFYILKDFNNQDTFLNGFIQEGKDIKGDFPFVEIDGNKAVISQFPLDHDEFGNEIVTKAGSGGKKYYIPLNEKDMLIIYKQARGDEQFEIDFENLISTFKFE